jgi:hypothetical protein
MFRLLLAFITVIALVAGIGTVANAEDDKNSVGFLFETGNGYGHIYTVRDYTLKEINNPPPAGVKAFPAAKLYYYDLQNDAITEISFAQAKKMTLFIGHDPLKPGQSPDGLTLGTYGDSHDVLNAITVNALHEAHTFYLFGTPHGFRYVRKLNLRTDSPDMYNPTLLAWVLK